MLNFPPATLSKSWAMTGLPPPPPPGDGPTCSSPPPPPPPRRADGPTVVQRGWEGLKVCEEAIFFFDLKKKVRVLFFQKMHVIWKRRMWERWAFVSCKKGCGGLWTLQGQGVRTSRLSKSSRRFRQPWCVFSPKQESRLCVSKEPVCTSFNVWLGFWPLLDSEHVECFMIVRNPRVIPEFSR